MWLLLDRSSGSRNPPADKELEAVSNLLTLFDLQEKLTNSIGEAASQDDRSALTNMQTLLSKVINDSCNYVRKSKLIITILIIIIKLIML